MNKRERISGIINEKSHMFNEVSDKIWEYAETRFEEYKSSELLCSVLREEGFQVEKGTAGMDTAFVASFGGGKPVIGILAEYDALSGMSQKAGTSVKEPVECGGSGHGCGHHALGTGALAAAVAVKEYMKENNLKGTVRLYGCPGEEGGAGKSFMAREGAFDDLDAVLTWHPSSLNAVVPLSTLANVHVCYKFHGVSAHAAMCPHLGRSALDAVELMNVGVNYLREHVIPEARMHYAVTNAGGKSPNVVQADAEVLYLIRAPKTPQVREIYERVCNVAKGAALMTGTTCEIELQSGYSNVIPNRTLEKVLHSSFMQAGATEADEQDVKFAEEMRSTLTENEKAGDLNMVRLVAGKDAKGMVEMLKDRPLADVLMPYAPIDKALPGSTDVGDVSWIVPTAQISTACYAFGTPGHSWQLVSQGTSEAFHKGMLKAGEVLALSTIELMENPELVEEAKEELKDTLNGESYVCALPEDMKPSSIH